MSQPRGAVLFHYMRVGVCAVLAFLLTSAQDVLVQEAQAQTPVAVTLQPATAPTAAVPGVTIVSVMGSGFPVGTIPAGNVTVALTPASTGR
jgi:hypothetical protein